jgi:hypothetical protein
MLLTYHFCFSVDARHHLIDEQLCGADNRLVASSLWFAFATWTAVVHFFVAHGSNSLRVSHRVHLFVAVTCFELVLVLTVSIRREMQRNSRRRQFHQRISFPFHSSSSTQLVKSCIFILHRSRILRISRSTSAPFRRICFRMKFTRPRRHPRISATSCLRATDIVPLFAMTSTTVPQIKK